MRVRSPRRRSPSGWMGSRADDLPPSGAAGLQDVRSFSAARCAENAIVGGNRWTARPVSVGDPACYRRRAMRPPRRAPSPPRAQRRLTTGNGKTRANKAPPVLDIVPAEPLPADKVLGDPAWHLDPKVAEQVEETLSTLTLRRRRFLKHYLESGSIGGSARQRRGDRRAGRAADGGNAPAGAPGDHAACHVCGPAGVRESCCG
jgi:hypothetical protein